LGRRRRRVIRIVKKRLPTVFMCPRCGEEAVRVTIAKDTGKAVVLCAMCQLKDEFQAHPAAQAIDVYSYFTDKFYGVKDPRPIIPKDRPIPRFHAEEIEEATATPEPPVAEEPVLEPTLETKVETQTTALSTHEATTALAETPTIPRRTSRNLRHQRVSRQRRKNPSLIFSKTRTRNDTVPTRCLRNPPNLASQPSKLDSSYSYLIRDSFSRKLSGASCPRPQQVM